MPYMKENLNKVVAAIHDDALVKLTRDMIRIPSPNFGEGAVADFLAERMRGIGMEVQMMTVEHPTEKGKATRQAIGRLRGTGGGPTLMFNGHTDVNVTMPGWSVDPHEGKLEDGMIWGLGAQDDKGGLAAALVAIEAIVKSGIRLKGELLYCPVATHKLGGTGTRTLLRKGVRADYCINIEHSANTIGSVIVGSVRVKLRTTTPGLFFRFTTEARADYLNAIEQQMLCLEAFGPSLVAVPEGGWLRFKRHPELKDFPMIRHDAIHKDHYGRWCDLVFQVRTVPGMTLDSVREDVARVLRAIKARHPKFDCEATIPANGPDDPFFMEPTELPDSHPLVRALAEGYRAATGAAPLVGSVERIGNFGDGNVVHAAGIPSVQFGPGDIKRYPEWPCPDERVHVDELRITARTSAYAALALCG
jgi:acetylornithine deacetylase/succinyl-diaminopimelate desuccinylase-like protein